jgi:coronatine-insensitive protein 1
MQETQKTSKVRVELGDDDPQLGLTDVDAGYHDLEYIAAYVSDITNGALKSIGISFKKLYDYWLVLLDMQK